LFGGAGPGAQGFLVDTRLAGDLPQRPFRRAGRLDGVPAELLGVLRLASHENVLPQTGVRDQGVRSKGTTSSGTNGHHESATAAVHALPVPVSGEPACDGVGEWCVEA
jgi:hypothetical protein